MRLCLSLLNRLKSGQIWLCVVVVMLFMMYYFHQTRQRKQFSTAVELRLKLSSHPEEGIWQSAGLQLRPGRDSLQRYHRSKGLNRYILSLNYWEQFTMATVNLFGLVCLGKLWNATTVQPFTFNSRLYGLRNLKPGRFVYLLCKAACFPRASGHLSLHSCCWLVLYYSHRGGT